MNHMSFNTFSVDDEGVISFMGKPFAAIDFTFNVPEERQRVQAALDEAGKLLSIVCPPMMTLGPRPFVLERDTDVTGVSGTGIVAEGVCFSDGVVALRWTSDWPTSVVFHERGMDSVEAVHGHGGATRVIWL